MWLKLDQKNRTKWIMRLETQWRFPYTLAEHERDLQGHLLTFMTSIALLFWYDSQFTSCCHWEANRKTWLCCSYIHCSAGNPHSFSLFASSLFYLFCFHRVLGRFHDGISTCTSAYHLDLNILTWMSDLCCSNQRKLKSLSCTNPLFLLRTLWSCINLEQVYVPFCILFH